MLRQVHGLKLLFHLYCSLAGSCCSLGSIAAFLLKRRDSYFNSPCISGSSGMICAVWMSPRESISWPLWGLFWRTITPSPVKRQKIGAFYFPRKFTFVTRSLMQQDAGFGRIMSSAEFSCVGLFSPTSELHMTHSNSDPADMAGSPTPTALSQKD